MFRVWAGESEWCRGELPSGRRAWDGIVYGLAESQWDCEGFEYSW